MTLQNNRWQRPTLACLIGATFSLGMSLLSGAAIAASTITVTYYPVGVQVAGGLYPKLSADGHYVAYNVAYGGTTWDVFELDLQTGVSGQANLMVTGGVPSDAPSGANCQLPAISGDGHYVVFGCKNASAMGGPSPAPLGGSYYVYDRINNKTNALVTTNLNSINAIGHYAAISADGRYVAYSSVDTKNNATMYVRDMFSNTLAAMGTVYLPSASPSPLTISNDGRYVAYSGRAVASGILENPYVYDSVTGANELINVRADGTSGNDGATLPMPVMSADGNVVVFTSPDTQITSPATAHGGIYVRDRHAGTTGFIIGGNYFTLSPNGRYVAYVTDNLYVYDRLTKVARIVPGAYSVSSGNVYTIISPSSFSADGRYLAFDSQNGQNKMRSIGIADLGVAAGLVLSSDPLTLTEGGAAGTYTVALAQVPAANVTVTITPDKQLTVARTQLTFTPANWNVPQVVSVQAIQDNIAEGTRSGTVTQTVTSTDVDYTVIPPTPFTVTINDAVVPAITAPPTSWSQPNLPLAGTAAPGSTVLVTAVNRDTSAVISVSAVADSQGNWSCTLAGLTTGVYDLDAQANGITGVVQTITVSLPPPVGLTQ